MIILAAKNSPNYQPISMTPLPGSDLETLPVRVTRTPTIDGAAVVSHFGMSEADITFTINAQLTAEENERLAAMMNNDTSFLLSVDNGFYEGAIESRSGDGGKVDIKFLVSEAYETPAVETDPPVEDTIENATSGYITDRASDGMTYDAGYSVPIYLGYIDPSASTMGRMTAFVLFNSIDLPAGGVISATLNFPGGMLSKTSSDFLSYDIKNKIYCHDVDTSAVPADRADFLTYPKTSAFTQWDFNINTPLYTPVATPDIATAINEVLSRPGWAPGNNLMIVIQSDAYPGNGVSVRGLILIQYPFTAQDYPAELIVTY
jgi:hypothetical protein